MGGEHADFQKRRTRIEQAGDPFARQDLAAGDMALAGGFAAAVERDLCGGAHQLQGILMGLAVGREFGAARG